MRYKHAIVISFLIHFSFSAFASVELDKQYSFQNFVVAVVSQSEEPIHSQQVEEAIVANLKKQSRFNFDSAASKDLTQNIVAMSGPTVSGSLTEKFDLYRPTLEALKDKGIDSALLAEILRKDEGLDLTLTLVATAPGEVIAQAVQKIEPPLSQENLSQKTDLAFSEIRQVIPFEGSILKREGYLVILDGGAGVFSPGMRLPTLTVEKPEGALSFQETGQILVEKAEENISFGRVLVEKKPLEVLAGNKLRTSQNLSLEEVPELAAAVSEANRNPASEILSDFEVTKGQLGKLSLNTGLDIVQFENLSSSGASQSANLFFPGAQVQGELWFTSRWYMDTALGFSRANYANTLGASANSQSSSLSQFRLQFGYRMNVLAPERGPVVYTKLGYGKQAYELGAEEPVRFASLTYGGMLLSGGIQVPWNDTAQLGIEINTLIFPSLLQNPIISGPEASNISSWDFVLKGSFSLGDKWDLDGRLIFRNASSEFLGESELADPITQASQSSKIAQIGVSYYF